MPIEEAKRSYEPKIIEETVQSFSEYKERSMKEPKK